MQGYTLDKAAFSLAGHKVGGVFVTPALWAINYSEHGNKPDGIDAGLYATGFLGAFCSPAAIAVGTVKAIVDDDIDANLRQVQAGEDQLYRPFIKPCYKYSSSAPQINATVIASKGGTAWKHPNGLWVYITDKRGFLVNDFRPEKSIMTYGPKLPLEKGRNGRFLWEMKK